MKRIDLTGNRYGKLEVVGFEGVGNGRKSLWRCRCDCGKETVVAASNLKSGNTKSCGCGEVANRQKLMENFYDNHYKHGTGNDSKLYRTWKHMKERCNNSNCKDYDLYGGRGIKVCDEWMGKDGFVHFSKWAMENGYSDNLTIDRIDNNVGYFPDNCRWSSATEQANNRRTNAFITANGISKTIAEWSKERGIKYERISDRVKRGWTAEEALEFCDRKPKSGKRKYSANEV